MIFGQSGWWAGRVLIIIRRHCSCLLVAGSADDRARMSESIAETPFAGRPTGGCRKRSPSGAMQLGGWPPQDGKRGCTRLRLPCSWRWRRRRRWPTTCGYESPGAAARTALWQGTISRQRGIALRAAAVGRRGRRARLDVARGRRRAARRSSSSGSGVRGATTASTCWSPPRRRQSCSCNSRPPTIPRRRRPSRFRWPISPASSSARNSTTGATAWWRCGRRAIRCGCVSPATAWSLRPARRSISPSSRMPCLCPTGGNARIKIQLLGGGKELWSQQHDVQADRAEAIPVEVPLPGEEGVYDIAITAANNPNWSQAVRQPLSWKRTIAERRVQLVVLHPQRPAARADREFTQIVEIDPANPKWFEKLNEKLSRLPQLPLTKTQLPRLWKGPLGNDCLQTRRHPLGELAELRPNADSPDVSWEAYWLPISQPGRPHILEVDYPSDVPQTLGLCILEPDAAGAMAPIGVDSGVDNAAEVVAPDEAPRWLRHRLIFWPRTATPLLLVSNGRDRAPAVYGKIRVLADGEHLPRALRRAGGGQPPAAGGLSRPPADPRKLLGQRVFRSPERPQPPRLADVLRGRHAAGRVSQPCRLQRSDAGGAGRRQHDLPERAGASRRRATIRACSSLPARTRSAKTCWRCSCGCSTGKSCN